MACAACASSPRIRYSRPRSSPNPMSPNITGTSSTSIWTDIAPRLESILTPGSLLLTSSSLLRLLISTRSYKFGPIRPFCFALLRLRMALLFLHGREKRLGEFRQLRFLFRRKRFYEMRRNHHQQLVGRF